MAIPRATVNYQLCRLVTMAKRNSSRKASVNRNTNETQISVSLDLDGEGVSKLSTGVPFLDHMLDQVARHGAIDLEIKAKGDLHIDAHHTIEDVGITLGQAVAKALGDKKGITRYGHAYVPLDEALSRVVVDFSGRPGLEYRVKFVRPLVGEFDLDLVREFFQGFINARRYSRRLGVLCGWPWRSIYGHWVRSPPPREACSQAAVRVMLRDS